MISSALASCAISRETRGSSIPRAERKTYPTRPLQSKPLSGLLPPQRYGVPSRVMARRSSDCTLPLSAALPTTTLPLAALLVS
ncbi:hypothetical protein D3C78_1631440 [compost metagenome]